MYVHLNFLYTYVFRLAEFLPKEYVKIKGIEKLIYQVCMDAHVFCRQGECVCDILCMQANTDCSNESNVISQINSTISPLVTEAMRPSCD